MMTSIKLSTVLVLFPLLLAMTMLHCVTNAAAVSSSSAEARVVSSTMPHYYKLHTSTTTTRARTMEFLAFNEGAMGYIPTPMH
jgi:hypothetical protein